jgi:putative acyl-CoA dehydrogenase
MSENRPPSIRPGFIQDGPQLKNSYESDELLKIFLKSRFPVKVLSEVAPDLSRFGERCVTDLLSLSERAESQPPRLVSYDSWGKRIDHIEVSEAWKELDRVAAEEGLIAIGYERKQGEFSRVYQFAKLYLFHPSSAFYTCPLAMTDGAARVLELHGAPKLKAGAFRHLTSRDPKQFWTSGQWMTEKTGGSDVSGTSTVAKADGSAYRLSGDKWFTSATTSQMTMALAKVEGATDAREGLSLFYVETRDSKGGLNNIRINRLKDKLGTKALPTAELTLDGTPGVLVGSVGEGVKKVSSLLNITRLYNSTCSIGTMARAIQLAKDYAKRRVAFGHALSEQPLHLQTLADLQAEFEGTFLLTFHLIHLLGKDETGSATTDESAILRLLTPVIKLWSAKQAISITSEVLESFGGAGYVEDTGLPHLLRDAQVFAIWEGTTNVLSLDALRAIAKDGSLPPFFKDIDARLSSVQSTSLQKEVSAAQDAVNGLKKYFQSVAGLSAEAQQAGARALALTLARLAAAALLLELAEGCAKSGERAGASEEIARRFCRHGFGTLLVSDDLETKRLKTIVYG